jgi:hypothetical protein
MCFKPCMLYFSTNSVTTSFYGPCSTRNSVYIEHNGGPETENNAKPNTGNSVTPNTEKNIGPNTENSVEPNTEKS